MKIAGDDPVVETHPANRHPSSPLCRTSRYLCDMPHWKVQCMDALWRNSDIVRKRQRERLIYFYTFKVSLWSHCVWNSAFESVSTRMNCVLENNLCISNIEEILNRVFGNIIALDSFIFGSDMQNEVIQVLKISRIGFCQRWHCCQPFLNCPNWVCSASPALLNGGFQSHGQIAPTLL